MFPTDTTRVKTLLASTFKQPERGEAYRIASSLKNLLSQRSKEENVEWRRFFADGCEYLAVSAGLFGDLMRGMGVDRRMAARLFLKAGLLLADGDRKRMTKTVRIGGKPRRCVVFRTDLLPS